MKARFVKSPVVTAPEARRHARPAAPAAAAISAAGVRKAFADHLVLDGVDLSVAEGSVFALLGPNGAGKTTMVNILVTLLRPDAGVIRVGGHDVVADPDGVRHAIGVTGQFSAVDTLLTGEENLRLVADLRHLGREPGQRRVAELLARFDLVEAAHKPVSTFSGGMKRRLDLAMTLLGNPSIIFLDEPTTGLDPRSRRTMWDIIGELVAERITIFLTTQYLDEADELADQIAILDRGRIVASGTPEELKRRLPGGHVELHFTDPRSMDRAARLLGYQAGDPETMRLQVPGDRSVAFIRSLLNRLDGAGIDAESLSIHEADLDDVFFALTGHPVMEAQP